MKTIYYVGFYSGERCSKRPNAEKNIAGSMKMDFIKDSLKQLGYKVILLSISIDYTIESADEEVVIVDSQEKHVYLPYRQYRIFGRYRGGIKSSVYELIKYGKRYFKNGDIVIAYHSLGYGKALKKLQDDVGIKLISQIEEIYCLSNFEGKGIRYLNKEIKMISSSNAYLMINEYVASKYSFGRPYAISYGNYRVFAERKINLKQKTIGIVYTGIINEDRGVFLILDAMRFLPNKYELHILGFGTDENIERMHQQIAEINKARNSDGIVFHGTKTGEDYTDFLSKYHIGISLMDTGENVAYNAFPSKILAYLGHSLLVVSSKSKCVMDSKIADAIFFTDNNPEDIAKTIKAIPLQEYESPANKLRECERDFLDNLQGLIQGL